MVRQTSKCYSTQKTELILLLNPLALKKKKMLRRDHRLIRWTQDCFDLTCQVQQTVSQLAEALIVGALLVA